MMNFFVCYFSLLVAYFRHKSFQVGTIGGTYLAASFIHHFKSWHQVFYIFGALTIVWCFLFVRFHLSFSFRRQICCFFFIFFFHRQKLKSKTTSEREKNGPILPIIGRLKRKMLLKKKKQQRKQNQTSIRQDAYWWFGSGNGFQ